MPNRKRAPRATLIYDAGCASCTKFAALVKRLDISGAITLASMYDPATEAAMRKKVGAAYDNSFHLILEPAGKVVSGENALEDLARLLTSAPFGGAVFKVPGVRGAAAGVYRAFAAGRTCAADTAEKVGKP